MLAVTSITFFVADVKCGWQKQQSKCYTWNKSGPKKCPETEPMLDWRSRTRTCSNTAIKHYL